MAIDIGRIAYQKYIDTLIEQGCDIDELKWEQLSKYNQDAWRAAAVAVLQYIEKEKKNLFNKEAVESDPTLD